MAASSGPSWYEILGVEPSATPAEIKAAWRAATDKFEPGSGASQFRLFNEAADTLLDPEKRAAYDAGLGMADAPASPAAEKPVAEKPAAPAPAEQPAVETPAPATHVEKPSRLAGVLDPLARSTVALATTAVLLVAAIVASVVLVLHVNDTVDEAATGPQGERGGKAAQAVAEDAMKAALSYDYRHIEVDRQKAGSYVAPSFRKEFLATYDLLTEGPNGTPGGAIKLKAVQTVDLKSSGVVDADAERARILVFLNTETTKTDAQPQVRAWRIRVTMVNQGGKWLIEGLDIY